MITYQDVIERVKSSDAHCRRALGCLLDLQTRAEEVIGDSIEANRAGFRAKYGDRDDAGVARKLINAEWGPKERRRALGLCWTYRRQLTALANGCRTRAEVGAFRVKAEHDRESRIYARAVVSGERTVKGLERAVKDLERAIKELKKAA